MFFFLILGIHMPVSYWHGSIACRVHLRVATGFRFTEKVSKIHDTQVYDKSSVCELLL